jgi:thiol-disulfide isomerase/thioredoxin
MQQVRRNGFWGAFGISLDEPIPDVQVGAPDRGNHLLWLRAGDRIPCKLLSIDDRGVTFETDLVEATFLPHAAIKAWDRVAGSQPRELDEVKFERLMTLPRMQRDNPPTHLIESVSGDFLRGRLESFNDETLTIEVRLEMKRIPRDRIARIIWLAEEETTPPEDASDVQRPATMRVQAVRSDGVRLTFDPQRFEGDVLSGASELLGACQTPVTQIDQLLLNGAIAEAASELAYAKWRLLAAADPRFVSEGAAEPGAESQPGVESALVGEPAPDLRLHMLEGEPFDLGGMRGKVVVIDFWATWCGWCMQSMPEIAAMVGEFDADKVALVPVNLQEDRGAVAAALERLGLEPHSALDIDGVAAARFAVTAIPQTVVVGPDGKVTHVFVGGGPGVVDQLRQAIRTALGEDAPPAEEGAEVPAAAGE